MFDAVMFISTCVSQEDRLESLLLICSNLAFRYLKAILLCIVGKLYCGKK